MQRGGISGVHFEAVLLNGIDGLSRIGFWPAFRGVESLKVASRICWHTPGERFDGTPFTDRGFGSVPALAGVADLLDAILVA